MIKKNQKLIRFLNIFSDALINLLSYYLAIFIKYILIDGQSANYPHSLSFRAIILFYSIVLPFSYYLFRVYAQSRLREEAGEYLTIMVCNLVGTLVISSLFYLNRITEFSRVALFFFWAISSFGVICKHFTGHRIVSHFRALGYNQRHVIVVGNGKNALRYVEDINNTKNKKHGYLLDGYVSAIKKDNLGKNLGSYEELERIIEQYDPDELVIALEPHEMDFIQHVMDIAGKEGTYVSLIPFYNDYIPANPEIEAIGRTKLINLRATPMDNALGAFLKRTGDILFASLMLCFLSPIMIFVAFGVKFSSPGPIFFRQERIGKDKKPFYMYKFRSMRVNSEENTAWSKNSDPRKTKFGTFIRKYSIDELPQLLNVLKGDMSLIGPRPEIPFYVRQFKETVPFYLVRQQVRPGMTGWAQVHGLRGDTSIEDRVQYDIWYIENWSILLDIKILFMTVFKGKFVNSEY